MQKILLYITLVIKIQVAIIRSCAQTLMATGYIHIRLLIVFTLSAIYLTAAAQDSPAKKNPFIYTDSTYTNFTGKGLTIENSLPKGGGTYTHSSGKTYSYVIFWNRIINETATPLAFAIKFPDDSLAIFPSTDSYVRIFLPPDTMTIGKETLGDYGLKGLKSFLDTGFYKRPALHRIINPKEAFIFYTGMLFHQARGSARTELVLKKEDLFYKIAVGSQHALIPCGHLIFLKKFRG